MYRLQASCWKLGTRAGDIIYLSANTAPSLLKYLDFIDPGPCLAERLQRKPIKI